MLVYSQLVSAQAENKASDYSAGTIGRFWINTATSLMKFDDGSAVRTVVTTDNTQTLTNKTISSASNTLTIIDNSFSIKDNSDNTKIAAFECSGITTETTRTFTFPDANTTIVGTDTTQTLTNKTLTSPILNTPKIAGGTASNNSRIVFPSDTLANITALTRAEGAVWYATDTDKLYKDDGTSLTEIGSGSSGSINYILNPDAESGTTGWAAYADAAATSPVDGTGGAPTVTITRTTTTPLRGTGSFLITKDAANRQGEGVGCAFTIDSADKAKVLNVSFDYETASGTFASGDSSDVRVFIYDVTNTVLIPVSPYTIQGGGSLQWKFTGTFQTASNSTSYRLILHCATTSASAYTFEFDNVVVGPQVVNYGAPMSDMTAWTPTGSWSANTTYTGFKKRIGDESIYLVKIALAGAPTATTLTVNLPSGETIDTAKVLSTDGKMRNLGLVSLDDTGTSNIIGTVAYESTTAVRIKNVGADAAYGRADESTVNTAPFTFASGDAIYIEFRVPISGWSSTVLMSNDTDTRVVAAIYSTNTATSIANGSAQILDFEDKTVDTHSAVTTGASWKYTAQVPGIYHVDARAQLAAAAWTATQQINLELYKNGSLYALLDHDTNQVSATVIYSQGGSVNISLVAGDYIDVRLTQNQGGAVALDGTAANNIISIHRLSGPSAIAATESINARYEVSGSTANASITAGATEIVDFESRVFDTHGSVTVGASWKFTAPIAGKYRVSAMAVLLSVADGKPLTLDIYKNGSVNTTLVKITTGAAGNQGASGSSVLSLSGGDYIDIRITNGDASDRTLSTTNNAWVTVERIGN